MLKELNSPAVGVALIGAGMIAERHVTALSALGGSVQLAAVVSRHPQRARHLAQHYAGPAPAFTSDLSLVVEDPGIQVVIVATPPSVRIELIEVLAAAGKHILLEKPVARNVEEAERVVQLCQASQVKLGVVFQHRARDSSRQLRRLLLDQSPGRPGYVDIAVPLWRAQSYYDELGRGTYARDGGGVLLTQAIHAIDLVLSLLGPVRRVQAMTATTPLHTMESEDVAVAGLQFDSGVAGSLVASTATFPHGRETTSVHCRDGSIRLDADRLVVSFHDGRTEHYPPPNDNQPPTPKFVWHQRIIEDFMSAIELDHEPMASGDDALASHRLIEAIEYSSQHGVAVDLPSPL